MWKSTFKYFFNSSNIILLIPYASDTRLFCYVFVSPQRIWFPFVSLTVNSAIFIYCNLYATLAHYTSNVLHDSSVDFLCSLFPFANIQISILWLSIHPSFHVFPLVFPPIFLWHSAFFFFISRVFFSIQFTNWLLFIFYHEFILLVHIYGLPAVL